MIEESITGLKNSESHGQCEHRYMKDSQLDFFAPEDFADPICIGPMKNLPERIAAHANSVLREKGTWKPSREKGRTLKSALEELFLIKAKLRGLSHLIESQNVELLCPSVEANYGIALLLNDIITKVRCVQRQLEVEE